jgi:hypothetical protein
MPPHPASGTPARLAAPVFNSGFALSHETYNGMLCVTRVPDPRIDALGQQRLLVTRRVEFRQSDQRRHPQFRPHLPTKDSGRTVGASDDQRPSGGHRSAYCERVIGSIRRECLDYLIPLNERHLKRIFREFITYYNRRRPHSALGPGFPEPIQVTVPASDHRHRLPAGYRVAKTPVLGGLHHEYRLEKEVA